MLRKASSVQIVAFINLAIYEKITKGLFRYHYWGVGGGFSIFVGKIWELPSERNLDAPL